MRLFLDFSTNRTHSVADESTQWVVSLKSSAHAPGEWVVNDAGNVDRDLAFDLVYPFVALLKDRRIVKPFCQDVRVHARKMGIGFD